MRILKTFSMREKAPEATSEMPDEPLGSQNPAEIVEMGNDEIVNDDLNRPSSEEFCLSNPGDDQQDEEVVGISGDEDAETDALASDTPPPLPESANSELSEVVLRRLDDTNASLLELGHSFDNQNNGVLDALEKVQEVLRTISSYSTQSRDLAQRNRQLEDHEIRESILLPVFNDLIALSDSLESFRGLAAPGLSPEAESFLSALEVELQSLMTRYGLTRRPDADGQVDPKYQQIVGVKQVAAPTNGAIIRVTKPCYEAFGRTVRPAAVIVQKVVQ